MFIISHFQAFVKSFSKLFLKLFSEAGINQVRFSPESRFPCGFCLTLSSLSRATALLYYHLSFSLSTPFFNLFSLSTNCILSPTLFPTSFQFCLRSVFFVAISFYIIYYGNDLMPDSSRNQDIRLIYQKAPPSEPPTAFRSPRRATKDSVLGSCKLLKKLEQNFCVVVLG